MAETFYATLAEVKTSLGLPSAADTAKDALITALLPQALDAINKFIGRDLRSTAYTEYVDGTGKSYFYPKHYPIISVSSIGDDYDHATSTAKANLGTTEYLIYNDTGKIALDPQGHATIGAFCSTPQGIKIVYTAGYATIPRDIAYVFSELVGLWTGLKTRTIIMGDGSVVEGIKAPTGIIPKELQAILQPYVKVKMA